MKRIFILFIITALCICKANNSTAQVNVNDSLALVDLYNSTDGPNWYIKDGWLSGPVSTWFRVYVENNRVVQLYFNFDNNLNGTLPASLGNLSELYTLVIDYNKISGTIPSSFANLSKLVTLAIDGCQISGSIPAFPSSFTKLISIQLQNNQLTGSIPSSIGYLPSLIGIQLDNNKLTGPIPSSFSTLQNLQILGVSNNQLSGSVPPLTNTTKISDLFLYNNQFSGPIPDFHTSNPYGEIGLDHNQFSGSIPDWLGTRTNIVQLALDHNKLTGVLPTNFGNLINISYLSLSNNELSGPIPTTLTNLKNFASLYIDNNHFNFDSLEYIVSNNHLYSFNYSPQLNITITYTPQGAYGKLSVHAGGTLSNNTYQWYRNNSLYKTIVGDSAFIVDSPGVYFVKVNNAIVTALQLTSDSITIEAACSAAPSNPATTSIKQTTARLNWNAAQGAVKYQIKFGATGGAVSTINTANAFFKLSGLTANTNYTWKVRSKCSLQYSAYATATSFTTLPAFAATAQSEDEINKENSFTISPNPATTNVKLMFNSFKQSAYSISVYDIAGKILLSKTGTANAGMNNFMLNVHALSAGTYLIKIHYDTDKTSIEKLVKE